MSAVELLEKGEKMILVNYFGKFVFKIKSFLLQIGPIYFRKISSKLRLENQSKFLSWFFAIFPRSPLDKFEVKKFLFSQLVFVIFSPL